MPHSLLQNLRIRAIKHTLAIINSNIYIKNPALIPKEQCAKIKRFSTIQFSCCKNFRSKQEWHNSTSSNKSSFAILVGVVLPIRLAKREICQILSEFPLNLLIRVVLHFKERRNKLLSNLRRQTSGCAPKLSKIFLHFIRSDIH